MLADIRSILVIDDEFDIVNPIKLSLQKHGFNAYGFTDPLLALEHFQNNSNNIDLILCDIRMPLAFSSLAQDPVIHHLLPYFSRFIYEEVKHSNQDLSLLFSLM